MLTGAQLTAVRELAERWGDGHVELTSRANLQLRALTSAHTGDLATRLRAAGLLPSQTHELVRNIAASPLSPAATRAMVAELDDRLCADPELAALPGRFLFALDDGSGDVAPGADVAATAVSAAGADGGRADGGRAGADGGRAMILLAGVDVGLRVGPADVLRALLAAAHAFLDERATQGTQQVGPAATDAAQRLAGGELAWRVRELVDGPARVAARTAAMLGVRLGAPGPPLIPRPREAIGIVAQPDGRMSVAALVPLGRLGGVPMMLLERAELLVVTQSRGVVVPDLTPSAAQSWREALADAGLEVTAGSPWSGVTTCAGRPGCGKALADVRRDAAAAVGSAAVGSAAAAVGAGVVPGARLLPVHWVGCARGCGSPDGRHVRVEAIRDGYQVTRPGLPSQDLPSQDLPGQDLPGQDLAGRVPAAEAGILVAAARRM